MDRMARLVSMSGSNTDFEDGLSTRTSFRLSDEAKRILDAMADEEEVSEKVLVDTYVTAIDQLLEGEGEARDDFLSLVRETPPVEGPRHSRVVTKGTLRRLNGIAERHEVSRDAVLEQVVRFAHHSYLAQCSARAEACEQVLKGLDKAVSEITDAVDGLNAKLKQAGIEDGLDSLGAIGLLLDKHEEDSEWLKRARLDWLSRRESYELLAADKNPLGLTDEEEAEIKLV